MYMCVHISVYASLFMLHRARLARQKVAIAAAAFGVGVTRRDKVFVRGLDQLQVVAVLFDRDNVHQAYNTCTHTYTYTHTHTHIHTYMHACIHTYIPSARYIHIHTYTHTYMHTCMHTYIHIHVYIHTYIMYMTYIYLHDMSDVSTQ